MVRFIYYQSPIEEKAMILPLPLPPPIRNIISCSLLILDILENNYHLQQKAPY